MVWLFFLLRMKSNRHLIFVLLEFEIVRTLCKSKKKVKLRWLSSNIQSIDIGHNHMIFMNNPILRNYVCSLSIFQSTNGYKWLKKKRAIPHTHMKSKWYVLMCGRKTELSHLLPLLFLFFNGTGTANITAQHLNSIYKIHTHTHFTGNGKVR